MLLVNVERYLKMLPTYLYLNLGKHGKTRAEKVILTQAARKTQRYEGHVEHKAYEAQEHARYKSTQSTQNTRARRAKGTCDTRARRARGK